MSGNNNNGDGTGDDSLPSFAGLDADTMNIFNSFTNDTAAGGNMGAVGFGMDLINPFDMAGDSSTNGGVDLSSMQLINLNDVSLNTNNSVINQQQLPGTSTNDAAQLMARLMGPTAAAAVNQQQQQPGLLASAAGPPPLPASSTNVQGKTAGARAGSESSDDMGDIPLAQLALGQGGGGNGGGSNHQQLPVVDSVPMTSSMNAQQNMATLLHNQAAMQALANIGNGGGGSGMLGMAQPNIPGGAMLNAALGDTLLAGLIPNRPPMLPQQQQQQVMPFMAHGNVPILQQQQQPALMHGLERVAGVTQPYVPMLANALEPINTMPSVTASVLPTPAQNGMTG
ncbi:hypothetical protein GGI21_005622, partial [Coemansia aciculifera]